MNRLLREQVEAAREAFGWLLKFSPMDGHSFGAVPREMFDKAAAALARLDQRDAK